LEQIGGVRSTKFVFINYSGTDSNGVQTLASNAVNMVVSFYATNEPCWDLKFVDSACFSPKSSWDKFEEGVSSSWQRCKDFVGW
jgi:hypothetical protein